MGCTKSKLDDKVCLKDETTSMHVAYINKNGLQKYYEVMGVKDVSNHNSFEDNSSNLNLGLINIVKKQKQCRKHKHWSHSKRVCRVGRSVDHSTRCHQDH